MENLLQISRRVVPHFFFVSRVDQRWIDKWITLSLSMLQVVIFVLFTLVLCVFVVPGKQWWWRRRRRSSSCRAERWTSCHLLRSAASPLSPSVGVPASVPPVSHCLLPAWCQRCLPASVCLPSLPHTLHLLAQGRNSLTLHQASVHTENVVIWVCFWGEGGFASKRELVLVNAYLTITFHPFTSGWGIYALDRPLACRRAN